MQIKKSHKCTVKRTGKNRRGKTEIDDRKRQEGTEEKLRQMKTNYSISLMVLTAFGCK